MARKKSSTLAPYGRPSSSISSRETEFFKLYIEEGAIDYSVYKLDLRLVPSSNRTFDRERVPVESIVLEENGTAADVCIQKSPGGDMQICSTDNNRDVDLNAAIVVRYLHEDFSKARMETVNGIFTIKNGALSTSFPVGRIVSIEKRGNEIVIGVAQQEEYGWPADE